MMPFSSNSGKKFTSLFFDKLIKYSPELFSLKEDENKFVNIDDHGCGSGTYYDLLAPKFQYMTNGTKPYVDIIGIEIYKPYIEQYKLEDKYTEVHSTDSVSYMKYNIKLNSMHDSPIKHACGIFGDVVEHLSIEDLNEFHNLALELYYFHIVSIPLGYYPQDEYQGNPHETHVTDNWSHESVLKKFHNCVLYHIENEIGIYIFSNKPDIIDSIKKAMSPKIGMYIICKNEVNFIKRCLESCLESDEIVVVDTGSTDNTKLIVNAIKNSTKANIKLVEANINPWRFDDAKNLALSFLSKEIDIAISLDADEMLEKDWHQKLVNEYDPLIDRYIHKFKTIWNWKDFANDSSIKENVSEHFHERIHNRHKFKWSLPVHEILQCSTEEKQKWIDLLMIQKPDTSKNRSSYKSLLEISVKENPNIWKSWSFLAQEYINDKQYYLAIDTYKKALTIDGSDKSFLYLQLANCNTQLYFLCIDEDERNLFKNRIYELYQQAIKFNNIRECWYYRLLFSESIKNTDDIKLCYDNLSKINTKTQGYMYNESCWSDDFDQRIAYFNQQLG